MNTIEHGRSAPAQGEDCDRFERAEVDAVRESAIGEVCELINGRAFKPSDWSDDGLPIVRIQNLNNEDALFNRYNGEVRDRFLIDSGALLFS